MDRYICMHGGTDDREIKWYTQIYLELKHFLELGIVLEIYDHDDSLVCLC